MASYYKKSAKVGQPIQAQNQNTGFYRAGREVVTYDQPIGPVVPMYKGHQVTQFSAPMGPVKHVQIRPTEQVAQEYIDTDQRGSTAQQQQTALDDQWTAVMNRLQMTQDSNEYTNLQRQRVALEQQIADFKASDEGNYLATYKNQAYQRAAQDNMQQTLNNYAMTTPPEILSMLANPETIPADEANKIEMKPKNTFDQNEVFKALAFQQFAKPEEKILWQLIQQKGTKEEIENTREYLVDIAAQRQAQAQTQGIQGAFGGETPTQGQRIGAGAASIPAFFGGLTALPDVIGTNVQNAVTGTYQPINDPLYQYAPRAANVLQEQSMKGASETGALVGEAIQTIAKSAIAALTGPAAPVVLGAAAAGTEAGALAGAGYNTDLVAQKAAVTGVAEAATEYLPLEGLRTALPGALKSTGKVFSKLASRGAKYAAYTLSDMPGELLSEVIDAAAQDQILNDPSGLKALPDNLKRTAIISAISSAIGGGVASGAVQEVVQNPPQLGLSIYDIADNPDLYSQQMAEMGLTEKDLEPQRLLQLSTFANSLEESGFTPQQVLEAVNNEYNLKLDSLDALRAPDEADLAATELSTPTPEQIQRDFDQTMVQGQFVDPNNRDDTGAMVLGTNQGDMTDANNFEDNDRQIVSEYFSELRDRAAAQNTEEQTPNKARQSVALDLEAERAAAQAYAEEVGFATGETTTSQMTPEDRIAMDAKTLTPAQRRTINTMLGVWRNQGLNESEVYANVNKWFKDKKPPMTKAGQKAANQTTTPLESDLITAPRVQSVQDVLDTKQSGQSVDDTMTNESGLPTNRPVQDISGNDIIRPRFETVKDKNGNAVRQRVGTKMFWEYKRQGDRLWRVKRTTQGNVVYQTSGDYAGEPAYEPYVEAGTPEARNRQSWASEADFLNERAQSYVQRATDSDINLEVTQGQEPVGENTQTLQTTPSKREVRTGLYEDQANAEARRLQENLPKAEAATLAKARAAAQKAKQKETAKKKNTATLKKAAELIKPTKPAKPAPVVEPVVEPEPPRREAPKPEPQSVKGVNSSNIESLASSTIEQVDGVDEALAKVVLNEDPFVTDQSPEERSKIEADARNLLASRLRDFVAGVTVPKAAKLYTSPKQGAKRTLTLLGKVIADMAYENGDIKTATKVIDFMTDNADTASAKAIDAVSRDVTPTTMLYAAQMKLKDATERVNSSRDPIFKGIAKRAGGTYDAAFTDAEAQTFMNLVARAQEETVGTRAYGEAIYKAKQMVYKKIPSSLVDQVLGVARMFMLTAPSMFVRNFVSNGVLVPTNLLVHAIQSGVDSVLGKKSGIRTTYRLGGGAFLRGWRSGVRNSILDYKHNTSTRGDLGLRYSEHDGPTFNPEFASNTVTRGIARLLAGTERLVNLGLDIGDRPYYEGYNQGILSTIYKKQLDKAGATVKVDPLAAVHASEMARYYIFQGNSTVFKMLRVVRTTLDKTTGGVAGRLFGPYIQTPGNVTDYTLRLNPIALAKSFTVDTAKFKHASKAYEAAVESGDARKIETATQNLATTQLNYARNVGMGMAGTITVGLVAALVKAGLMTGADGDEEKAEKLLNDLDGKQAFALKIGDYYIGTDGLGPVSTMIKTGAMLADAKTPKEIVNAMTLPAIEDISELPFVNLAASMLGSSDMADALFSSVSSLPQQWIPSAMKSVTRALDPYQREIYVKGNNVESLKRQYMSQIPWLRNKVPYKLDQGGNPMPADGTPLTRLVSPVPITGGSIQMSTKDEAAAKQLTIAEELNRLGANDAIMTKTEKFTHDEVEYNASNGFDTAAQEKFAKTKGSVRDKLMWDVMHAPSYAELSKQDQAALMSKITKYALNVAKNEFDPEIPIPDNQQAMFDAPDPAKYALVEQLLADKTWYIGDDSIPLNDSLEPEAIYEKMHKVEIIENEIPKKDQAYYLKAFKLNAPQIKEKYAAELGNVAEDQAELKQQETVESYPNRITDVEQREYDDLTTTEAQEAYDSKLSPSDYLHIKDRRAYYEWNDKYNWYYNTLGLAQEQVRGAFQSFEITSGEDKAEMVVAQDSWKNGKTDYTDAYIMNNSFEHNMDGEYTAKEWKPIHDEQLYNWLSTQKYSDDEKAYMFACFKEGDWGYYAWAKNGGKEPKGSGGSGGRGRGGGSGSSGKAPAVVTMPKQPKIGSVKQPVSSTKGATPASFRSYAKGAAYAMAKYVPSTAERVQRTVKATDNIESVARAAAKALKR